MEDPILEYNILNAVHGNDGRLTQRSISKQLGRSVSSINFALRLLAVKGFIKISGANPRHLKYHLTSRGLIQKTTLAYNFLKRQRALYEEVRNNLLGKLKTLPAKKVGKVSVYGWTPFTESAILYLISSGIQVTALYMENIEGAVPCNRIPLKVLDEFHPDCEALVLMEPLPKIYEEKVSIKKVVCFPIP
jgi:DNA-binding Lrp family transcriptional regulator